MTGMERTDGSLILRRSARVAAALALSALTLVCAPANAAPVSQSDNLSGTWQVSRTCVSGCTGTTTLTELVRPYRGAVDMATGSVPMVLYRIGKHKVLVHAATSSSLLSILVPGQLMRGPSVDQMGNTLRSTWRCIAAPAVRGSTRGSLAKGLRPEVAPSSRPIC
jgi:hypothetical protein